MKKQLTGYHDFAALIVGKTKFTAPKSKKHNKKRASFTSTRSALHRGRRISVKTTYRIEIDGQPLLLHTEARDDGTVHCHGLPNYVFSSAVDLARRLIDMSYLARVSRDELSLVSTEKGGH